MPGLARWEHSLKHMLPVSSGQKEILVKNADACIKVIFSSVIFHVRSAESKDFRAASPCSSDTGFLPEPFFH